MSRSNGVTTGAGGGSWHEDISGRSKSCKNSSRDSGAIGLSWMPDSNTTSSSPVLDSVAVAAVESTLVSLKHEINDQLTMDDSIGPMRDCIRERRNYSGRWGMHVRDRYCFGLRRARRDEGIRNCMNPRSDVEPFGRIVGSKRVGIRKTTFPFQDRDGG